MGAARRNSYFLRHAKPSDSRTAETNTGKLATIQQAFYKFVGKRDAPLGAYPSP